MSNFMKTVELSKVPTNGMLTVDVGGDSVLLANVEGKLYGMGAICSHEQWDLSEGTLHGTSVTCAGHGSVWDLNTGKAVFDEPLEDEPLYEVKVQDGYIYIRKK